MCGLIYLRRKDGKPAYKAVLKRYHKQRSRGMDGYGYVAIKDNKVVSYKRAEEERDIISMLSQEDAPEILFHHRFPTSTPNIEECAHPIVVESDKLDHTYFVAHNGVMRNVDKFKELHEKGGFKYTTEVASFVKTFTGREYLVGTKWNDSETLAIETALMLDGKQKDIGVTGPAAVIGLKVSKDGGVLERFFFRNTSNPLMFHEDAVLTVLSSEGSGTKIDTLDVNTLNPEGGFISHKQWSPPAAWENTYKHGKDWDDDHYMGGHAGFRTALPAKTSPPIKAYSEDDMRQMTLDETKSVGSIIEDAMEELKEIRALPEDELWAAFDNCIGDLNEIEAQIRVHDARSDESVYSDEWIEDREDLIEKKNELVRLSNQLEYEITHRDTRNGITVKIG